MTNNKTPRDFAYELINRTYESHESLLKACLNHMTNQDISEMLKSNCDILDCFTENYLGKFGIRTESK